MADVIQFPTTAGYLRSIIDKYGEPPAETAVILILPVVRIDGTHHRRPRREKRPEPPFPYW